MIFTIDQHDAPDRIARAIVMTLRLEVDAVMDAQSIESRNQEAVDRADTLDAMATSLEVFLTPGEGT